MKKFSNILKQSDIEYILNSFEKDTSGQSYNLTNDSTIIVRKPDYLNDFLIKLKPTIEQEMGFNLIPKYSAIIKYFKGSILPKHYDNAAPYGISILLSQSGNEENPFWVYNDKKNIITLNEGDGYFFNGGKLYHERPPIKSDTYIVCYLGYRILPDVTPI